MSVRVDLLERFSDLMHVPQASWHVFLRRAGRPAVDDNSQQIIHACQMNAWVIACVVIIT